MAERRFYQGETFANYDPGELLENAEFEDCVFDHCRWLGTRVQNCRFNACTFDHCNFSGVVFSFTTMKDAWMLNSAFRSMAWGGLQGKSGVFQPFGKINPSLRPILIIGSIVKIIPSSITGPVPFFPQCITFGLS